jgi:hypothetical protein
MEKERAKKNNVNCLRALVKLLIIREDLLPIGVHNRVLRLVAPVPPLGVL